MAEKGKWSDLYSTEDRNDFESRGAKRWESSMEKKEMRNKMVFVLGEEKCFCARLYISSLCPIALFPHPEPP